MTDLGEKIELSSKETSRSMSEVVSATAGRNGECTAAATEQYLRYVVSSLWRAGQWTKTSGDRCWSLTSRKHKVYIYHFIFKCRIYIYTIHIYLHSGTRGSIRRIFSIVWYAEVFNSINHFVVICFNCRNKKAYQSYNSYYCQYQTNPFEA